MRIFMTRREAEMTVDALRTKMDHVPQEEYEELEAVVSRFETVCDTQCKRDRTSYYAE